MIPRCLLLVCFLGAIVEGMVLSDSVENQLQSNRSISEDNILHYKRSSPVKSKQLSKRVQAGDKIPSEHTVDELVLELAKKHLLNMIVEEQASMGQVKKSLQTLQQDCCSPIKSVQLPVTHNARQRTQGAWMKDPLGIMGQDTIFVMESYCARRDVEEFENMEAFKAGIAHKKHTLPYNYDGTGAVVYGPFLYYNRENSPKVVKFNLKTNKLEAEITLSGFTQRRNGYRWCGGYCAVDLAVDEQGLWALWGDSDNSRRLYAQKIDVVKNVVTRSYALSTEGMNTMGNAFVACGIIYTIDEYNPRETTINFAYDTKTGRTWNPNIKFTNQYGYNSMVDYNPTEKVLYAWDNQRLVTYPLTFEERQQ
ncbi:olfactomedin-like protein 2A [Montipora capricornis]|uniref:olfactomedin-like protein 2A n=1 Tax=Montipora capricornis TaxID=246305 RepID=UPI0035F1448B